MTSPAKPSRKPRVLFVAEAVTLAHVARPHFLARALDQSRYEVLFAAADRYRELFDGDALAHYKIESISGEQFLAALAHGRPLHDAATLRGYVHADLRLLEELRPEVVVGDLRHSLSISARIARVPYLTIVNAYWSPYANPQFTVPAVPATRILPISLADAIFQVVRPYAFQAHCAPLNQVRKEFGLPPLRKGIPEMYTDADWVLYPDLPELIPTRDLAATHRYLAPILWSAAVPIPSWWSRIPDDRPVVYVTQGSSGSEQTLEILLDALAGEPLTVLAASVGFAGPLPPNVFAAPYLPGLDAAARASLVVCNGGSPTSYQALAAGRPVLGIPSNMDQHLNMYYVARAGAGGQIRSERLTRKRVREAVWRLLREPSYASHARRLQQAIAASHTAERFEAVLREALRAGAP